jgi:hypothetical protein
MKTLYIVDRVALGERRLPCRRGMIFVTDIGGRTWHAIIYDPKPGALDDFESGKAVLFGAVAENGVWLEGLGRLQKGDRGRARYFQGLGVLQASGEATEPACNVTPEAAWAAEDEELQAG